MASYLYRAVSLNARMESLSTSLKKVVMENNCLPPEDATLYQNLLAQMVVDFNGFEKLNPDGSPDTSTPPYVISSGNVTFNDTNPNDDFISGMHWNYGSNAVLTGTEITSLTGTVYTLTGGSWGSGTRNIVEKDMSKPREYGDVQIVQLRVGVHQPLWGWGFSQSTKATSADYSYSGQSADITNADGGFNRARIDSRGTEFTYTYYVPCLKYKTTNMY